MKEKGETPLKGWNEHPPTPLNHTRYRINEALLFGAAVMFVNALVVLAILPSRIRSPREEAKPLAVQEQALHGAATAGD